jgi:NADPH:quinone reductase
MKAIRVGSYGGPDQLVYKDIDEPAAQPNEALVKIEAIGVNFIDELAVCQKVADAVAHRRAE